MKKKAKAKVKKPSAKSHKTKGQRRSSGTAEVVVERRSANAELREDPRFAQAVQNYEGGVKAMQEHKFERAKGLLEKVAAGPVRELADRAAMHINSCNQQLAKSQGGGFKSPEEHYDYAISLMNSGSFDDARSHLEKILRSHPKADYAHYGMAVLECLQGRFEQSLKSLTDAIRLNAANRFQARNDADFERLMDDPRFTEVLYPEPGEMQTEIEERGRKKSNARA